MYEKYSPEYISWLGMKSRCYYTRNASYKYYGGRGIKVCDRWKGKNGFTNFLEDLGKRPQLNYSLDRIDSKGDYTPENCRWASKTTQVINRGPNKRNKTGHRGVCWSTAQKRYRVSVGKIFIGYSKDLQEAVKLRKANEYLLGVNDVL